MIIEAITIKVTLQCLFSNEINCSVSTIKQNYDFCCLFINDATINIFLINIFFDSFFYFAFKLKFSFVKKVITCKIKVFINY